MLCGGHMNVMWLSHESHVRPQGCHVRSHGSHVRSQGYHVRLHGSHVRSHGCHVRSHGCYVEVTWMSCVVSYTYGLLAASPVT